MDKPQVIKVRPEHIDDDMQSPVISGLLERGYVIASVIILEDPRRPEGDRIRLGLIMVPPAVQALEVQAVPSMAMMVLLGLITGSAVASAVLLAVLLFAG